MKKFEIRQLIRNKHTKCVARITSGEVWTIPELAVERVYILNGKDFWCEEDLNKHWESVDCND